MIEKKKSPKAVCILFQALTTSIVIEFFPYKLVWNEGLHNLPKEKAAASWLCTSRTKCEPVFLKIDGNISLKYLLTRSTFSSWILSSNLRKLFLKQRAWMIITWLKTNNYQGLFWKDKHSKPKSQRLHKMSQRLHSSCQYVDIDKIPESRPFILFNFIAISVTCF